jgi:hypothetical protein
MADLYMGLSILTGLFFVKVVMMFGRHPWLFVLSAIPILLILWNLRMAWQGAYREAKRLELLCRNTFLVNLSITMILTIQQSIL